MVNYGGVATKRSPYRVFLYNTDPSKILAFGPGVESGLKPNVPTYFNIDCNEAGEGEIEAFIVHEETNQEVPVKLRDNNDGTFSADYLPKDVGTYNVNLLYSGEPVPLTPIKVHVLPAIDISKVKVDGLEPSKYP